MFTLRTRVVVLTILTWATLSTFTLVQALQAQSSPAQSIHVGDSAADGSSLKTYKNAWKVVYEIAGKEPFLVGAWTDELSAVDINGRHLLKRTQMADYAKYNIVTTYLNVFDPKTMAPVFSDFKRSDTGEWAHRDFDGARVTYRRGSRADENKTGSLQMAEPVFDYNGGLYGVLLAALPLKEGLTATFPTLSEDRDELDRITIKVGKQELVEAGRGKQVMAWPVDTEGNYANKSHSIFWITKDPPYVIKLVTTIPGSKLVTVTISMI
ncbi:MAG: hypothetical protein ACHP8A_06855 [Terriglobales bacterium]